jgi:hypothetical protein
VESLVHAKKSDEAFAGGNSRAGWRGPEPE